MTILQQLSAAILLTLSASAAEATNGANIATCGAIESYVQQDVPHQDVPRPASNALINCSESESCVAIGGNLVVQGDDEEVDGHSLVLDGSVSIAAADTATNEKAAAILLQAGSGTNVIGGSGGDFFAFAGDTAAGKLPSFVRFPLPPVCFSHCVSLPLPLQKFLRVDYPV